MKGQHLLHSPEEYAPYTYRESLAKLGGQPDEVAVPPHDGEGTELELRAIRRRVDLREHQNLDVGNKLWLRWHI
jgi:hypothetical protein